MTKTHVRILVGASFDCQVEDRRTLSCNPIGSYAILSGATPAQEKGGAE
ncbi:MAG: hypothetical protein AB1555_12960 [Nitrospirota bacterium]